MIPPKKLVAFVPSPPATSVAWEKTGRPLLGEPVAKEITIARIIPVSKALVRKLESLAAAPAPLKLRKMTRIAKQRAITVGHR